MKARFNKYFKKLLSKRVMLFAGVAIILLVLIFVFLAARTVYGYYSLSPAVKNVVSVNKIITPGLPKQLVISSIGIKVDIEYVGLTSDGSMYIEPNSETVGWYMLGARPGDIGSAVIAGHYGWGADGRPAIFNDIQKLNKGDEISVIDQKEQTTTFVVREIREYDANSDASEVFKSDDNNRHLNLVTCNGTWENDKQSYSNRLVVFSDMK